MTKREFLRQFISPFIAGDNSDAMIDSLADETQRLEDLSIAVNDQLYISTASEEYLDKRLAELDITRPPELGMDDLAFRNMGIQINAAKQITEVLHTVLDTFYGSETVRAWTESGLAGPYELQDGMELILQFEDGSNRTMTIRSTDFNNISEATAQEVSDVVSRFIRAQGLQGFAQAYTDIDTNLSYVRIFGGAKGPYSLIKVMGGEVQNVLEFPTMRGTDLAMNTTVYQVTRTVGNTLRFRWISGPQPLLDKIFVADRVMMYGPDFKNNNLQGTFDIANVRPPQPAPSLDAGWFEVVNPSIATLKSTQPGNNPLPNTITETYSYTVALNSYQDLKFFLAKKNTPYSQPRYALAFEPAADLLKIYIPASTRVVRRDLIGAAHLHLLYDAENLNGGFGSSTDETRKIVVISPTAISYAQPGADNYGSGGILSYGITQVDIDYVMRENGRATVFTKTPHGIAGDFAWSGVVNYFPNDVVYLDGKFYRSVTATGPGNGGSVKPSPYTPQWAFTVYGENKSSTIISVQVANVLADNPDQPFLGAYAVDPAVSYTLTSTFATAREKVLTGENRRTLFVKGLVPNERGLLLFDLNRDNQEGPVPYIGSQLQSAPISVSILSISQNGLNLTVQTTTPHGAIPGSTVVITGTSFFNGSYTVNTVSSANTYTATAGIPQVASQVSTGFSATQVEGVASTIILDPSYTFKNNHDIGADVTLLSDSQAYVPSPDGQDYATYVTGTSDARIFVQSLMTQITALGIKIEIVVVYPNDIGLGNQGGSGDETDPFASEKIYVWGKT
jgi:hypothetical protein